MKQTDKHKSNVTNLLWIIIKLTRNHKRNLTEAYKKHTKSQSYGFLYPLQYWSNQTSRPPIAQIVILWWIRHVPVPGM